LPRVQPGAGSRGNRHGVARSGLAHAVGVMGYYLADSVRALSPGESARGIKCVTLTDEILHDHFPDFPMLPGALVVEAAAQLSGFLLEMTFNAAAGARPVVRAVLAQIQRAKFHHAVEPCDCLVIVAPTGGIYASSAH